MTPEQLEVANKYKSFHMDRFFGPNSGVDNVEFRQGYIEDLSTKDGGAGIEDNSVDLVISNCVLNLSPRKEQVYSEVLRILKTGGEFYFSDVFSNRRLSEKAKNDPVIVGECLGGAMYWEDFRRLMYKLGVYDFRVVSESPIEIRDKEIESVLGTETKFTSVTVRIFKLPGLLEDRCEDYGQIGIYKGTISSSPFAFDLDNHHHFETNRPMLICSNTAYMLTHTVLKEHFTVIGDASGPHFGLFEACSTTSTNDSASNGDSSCTTGGCC